ncbi:MAG: response regulator [Bacteroidetes bacterium]|jgi:DNA-binding NtrC family response regulator|nr:response regulator [Bacteroidota bacterium]
MPASDATASPAPEEMPAVDPVEAPVHIIVATTATDEGKALEHRLAVDDEKNDVSRVHTLAHALEAIAQEAADACVIDHDLPDGNSLDFLQRLEASGHQRPVVVLLGDEGEEAAVAIMKAGAADYVRKQAQEGYLDEVAFKVKEAIHHYRLAQQVAQLAEHREQMRLLRTIHSTVATVKHEINNPLSIISGNAQLLVELARALDLGEDVAQPARDIEEASQRIAASLDKLGDLKQSILAQYSDEDPPASKR